MVPNLLRMTRKRGQVVELPRTSINREMPGSQPALSPSAAETVLPRQALTAADDSTSALNCAYAARPAARKRAAAALAAALASSGRHHAR